MYLRKLMKMGAIVIYAIYIFLIMREQNKNFDSEKLIDIVSPKNYVNFHPQHMSNICTIYSRNLIIHCYWWSI